MSWVAFLVAGSGPMTAYYGKIMDMSKPRAYVEHPVHGKKMIYLEERDQYLADGWHKPGEKPTVNQELTVETYSTGGELTIKAPEMKEEPVFHSPILQPTEELAKPKTYEDVKDDASDLSAWLNANYRLETNYRQGVKKLQQIAEEYDNSLKDNRESSDQSEG